LKKAENEKRIRFDGTKMIKNKKGECSQVLFSLTTLPTIRKHQKSPNKNSIFKLRQ